MADIIENSGKPVSNVVSGDKCKGDPGPSELIECFRMALVDIYRRKGQLAKAQEESKKKLLTKVAEDMISLARKELNEIIDHGISKPLSDESEAELTIDAIQTALVHMDVVRRKMGAIEQKLDAMSEALDKKMHEKRVEDDSFTN